MSGYHGIVGRPGWRCTRGLFHDGPCARHCQMWTNGGGSYHYECHRLPPFVAVVERAVKSGWPQVSRDDWCGEWEATK